MDKSVAIKNVRAIERNAKGEVINAIVIDLVNGTALVRNLKGFIIDLQNSSRLGGVNTDNITSVNHPKIQDELPRLRNGGTAHGDWGMVHAGELYEDTNPASKTFGKQIPYKKDHVRTNGFLSLEPNAKYLREELISKAYVQEEFAERYATAFGSSSTTSSTDEEEEMSAEMIAEIAGAGAEPEEVAESAKK